MTEPEVVPGQLDARSALAKGTSVVDAAEIRRMLGLPADAEDKELARALVVRVVRDEVAQLGSEIAQHRPSREQQDVSVIVAQRASYLARMPVTTSAGGLSIASLGDVRTLLAVLRAGALSQRRAAVSRIGELLTSDADMPSPFRKLAIDTLCSLRRIDLAYEVAHVLQTLSGAEGRAARAEQKAWQELLNRVEARVHAFWDEQEGEEPITALHGEERAHLLSRARDLPESVLRHIAAVIENTDGAADPAQQRTLVAAIEPGGDPRLVPSLRSVIEGHDAELFAPAVRCLSCIGDVRAHALLKDAYDRSARAEERLLLAAALGALGDARGLGYARETLSLGDPALIGGALDALAELGGTDDVQRIAEFLENADEAIVRSAVVALGRIADSRALVPLSRLRERARRSALRAEIEEATSAIHARMELLGEEPTPHDAASATWDTTRHAARTLAHSRDPAFVRARALGNYFLGYLWRTLGLRDRAIARFESAAALRPGWVEPVVVIAVLRGRHGEIAHALSAFRRALEIDRSYIENHSLAITAMAQAFLRRAEAVDREGRADIARGLVEEILACDLRKAAAGVRSALQERSDAHRTQAR